MHFDRPVPVNDELLIAVSFGRVLWMLEKAGATVPRTTQGIRPVIKCAENIVRWWLWEHRERGPTDTVTFPGETALPQCLMPVALWLGVREYSGIWQLGGGIGRGDVLGRFETGEVMGHLADGRGEAFRAALWEFRRGYREEVVHVPIWYEDAFVHWAVRMLTIWEGTPHANRLLLSRPEQWSSWCGLAGCPYPYVTTANFDMDGAIAAPDDVFVISRQPVQGNYRFINPRWGAFVVDRSLAARGGRDENGDEIIETVD